MSDTATIERAFNGRVVTVRDLIGWRQFVVDANGRLPSAGDLVRALDTNELAIVQHGGCWLIGFKPRGEVIVTG